jgi:hypothetical protein
VKFLFSQIISTNFSQFEQLKKKTVKKPVLDQLKTCFLFEVLKLRKICGKNWGKQD